MTRRNLFILLVALSAFGLTTGLTASLGLSSDQLGADTVAVAACDPDGIAVSYGVTPGAINTVNEVTLSGVDASCAGQAVTVQLMDATDASLDSVSGTVTLAGTDAVVSMSDLADASAVSKVSVVISGTDATP